jgi:hypothetical protein
VPSALQPYPRKMEVVIPAILDNGQGYLEWRPLSRDQMMEEHVRNITAAVRGTELCAACRIHN